MTRTGLFRYVVHVRLPEFLSRGWLPVADLGQSILCWHCECGEVSP